MPYLDPEDRAVVRALCKRVEEELGANVTYRYKWTEHILHAPRPVDAPPQAEPARPPAGQTAWTDPDRQGLMLRGNRQREVTVRSLDAA